MPDRLEATCRVVQGVTRGPMLQVGLPRRWWGPNLRPGRCCDGSGATTGAGQSAQVRVKGRRQGNVCGPDEVNLVTTPRGESLVGTPTGGR